MYNFEILNVAGLDFGLEGSRGETSVISLLRKLTFDSFVKKIPLFARNLKQREAF